MFIGDPIPFSNSAGDPTQNHKIIDAYLGVSYKYLQVSDDRGVSNKKLGISDEKLWVSNENLGCSSESLYKAGGRSPLKNIGYPIKTWGLKIKI